MSANQIIEKALSTTSEDEAIACLKMARKKGLKLTTDNKKLVSDMEDVINLSIRRIRFLEKEKDKISDELVNYQASLMAIVVLFGIIILLALTL